MKEIPQYGAGIDDWGILMFGYERGVLIKGGACFVQAL